MIETFKAYVKNYDLRNKFIEYKYWHTFRVVENAKELSELLKLNDEDTYLAETIALLHDIGRFEQLKRYNTLYDKGSMDHANYAVELLFEKNFIKNFKIDNKYYKIIKSAIYYHNKFEIGNELAERELLHAKIIRDADKIDIINKLIDKLEFNEVDMPLSAEVLNTIKNEKSVPYALIKNDNDKLAINFAYVFDINFNESIKIIYQNEGYQKYFNSIKNKKHFEEIYDIVINYMKKRMIQ